MYKFVKRTFDICSASLLLVIVSPLIIVLGLLVRINLGSPVFFSQIRTGKGMKHFNLIKFRTMTNARDSKGEFLPDHNRLTNFGQFLRSSSLDELLELINIIKGDMSVVGPRPLPPKYNAYFTDVEMLRFDIRCGLITPDSIDDNPIISWDKQLEYEAEYAKNISLYQDAKILFSVFRILFKRNKLNYGSFERKPLDIERKKFKL